MEIRSTNDILIEIMSRLPTKSLIRFQCVSKGWLHIISDPFFQRLQCQRSKDVISGFFFQGYDQFLQAKYVPISNGEVIVQNSILDFLPETVIVVASINGLLCCRNPGIYFQVVYVCNPVLKKYAKIEGPKGIKQLRGLGFYFDPFCYPMDDYSNFKLVCISRNDDLTLNHFHIYSSELREWRTSEEFCSYDSDLSNDGRGILANGVLYWMTFGSVLLAFDVQKQKSRVISFPVEFILQDSSTFRMCLGEYEHQLHCIWISDGSIQVWVLNCEYRWRLEFSISLASLEEDNPTFLYNEARRTSYLIDVPTWIQLLAFKDGLLLLKLHCGRGSSYENEILNEVTMRFYLYNIMTKRMEEICTLDELGYIRGLKTIEEIMTHAKWPLFIGGLKAHPCSMSLAPLRSA